MAFARHSSGSNAMNELIEQDQSVSNPNIGISSPYTALIGAKQVVLRSKSFETGGRERVGTWACGI